MKPKKWPHLVFSRERAPFCCSLCRAPAKTGVRVSSNQNPFFWALCDECADHVGDLAYDPAGKPVQIKIEEPLVLREIG